MGNINWNIPKIDAHVHFNYERVALLNYGAKNNIKYLSINTDIPFFKPLEDQEKTILKLKYAVGNQLHYVASFPMANWGSLNWESDVLSILKKSFSNGAIGVKVWKNIGMEVTDLDENYIGLDHHSFDSIFNYLEENDLVVLGHNGEPKNCWLPIEKMTVEQDRAYFKEHPEYHMYLHPEMPAYKDHLEARNRRLEKHPKLRFVGLHLASHEWNVDKIGDFLDKFPLAAVDLAERICHLQHQCKTDWQKVYNFFLKYQDRIIYGTDVIDDGSLSDKELIETMEAKYQMHWRFFTTKDTMSAPKVTGVFNGLKLPDEVIKKVDFENAMKWYKLPQ